MIMEQEDKNILLRDLCGRLPYGVKVSYYDLDEEILKCDTLEGVERSFVTVDGFQWEITDIKPYLIPLSSMTEEQKKQYYSLADDVTIKPGQGCYLGIKIHCIKLGISDNPHDEVWDYINLDALYWLNKNHFDYRGLIEKGLAIDARGLNIY